jgi:ankyrin repeat protein
MKDRFLAAIQKRDTNSALAILATRHSPPIEQDPIPNTLIRGFIVTFFLNILKIIFNFLRLPYQQGSMPAASSIDSIIRDPDVLVTAAYYRQIAVVTELIAAGADVNATGTKSPFTALSAAVLSGSLELINILLESGAFAGDVKLTFAQPLAYAVVQRNCCDPLNIIRALVANGADVNSFMPPKNGECHHFTCGPTYHIGTTTEYFYQGDFGYVNILTHAVLNNPNNQLGEDIVKLLIKLGANVNQECKLFTDSSSSIKKMFETVNFTPLAATLMIDNSKIAKVLINAGAKEHESFTDNMKSAYLNLLYEIENERKQAEAAERATAALSTLQQSKPIPVPSAPPMTLSRRGHIPVARVIRRAEDNPEADLATEDNVPNALPVSSSSNTTKLAVCLLGL